MNNNYWSKKLTALLLVIGLLSCCLAGSLAEGTDAAVVADLTTNEPTENPEKEPVLLASVNGEEIWSNYPIIENYLDQYSYYITADPSIEQYVLAMGMDAAVQETVVKQNLYNSLSEEKKIELQADGKKMWDETLNVYAAQLGGMSEESSEEEKTKARENAAAYIEMYYGYTEESYIEAYMLNTLVSEKLLEEFGEVVVSEDELLKYFNDGVEESKASYEADPDQYGFYFDRGQIDANGDPMLYVPEGFFTVNHILLQPDEELISTYYDLQAKFEEQQEKETDEQVGTDEQAGADEQGKEEAASDLTETEETVTQEMLDAAKKAIIDAVMPTVEEIFAKYNAGTSFEDLILEYGKDPGMENESNRINGYTIHKGSSTYLPEFVEAAEALNQDNNISDPVITSSGVHILHYVRELESGAVELTAELRESLTTALIEETNALNFQQMQEKWINEAEIVYTEQGQALLDAVKQLEENESAEESVETTEAAEEVLAGDQ